MELFQKKYLVVSRLQGHVDIHRFDGESEHNEQNGELVHSYEIAEKEDPVALVKFEEHDFVIVAYGSGTAYVIFFNAGKFDVDPLPVSLPSRKKLGPSQITAFSANPHSPGIFAYGGKDNDLQVARLFNPDSLSFTDALAWKPEVLFKAKNSEPDHLGIEVPVWVSAVLFHQTSTDTEFQLVSASRHGHIRTYNTTKSKKPTATYKVCEKPILTLTFADEKEESVIITDSHTYAARLSLTQTDARAHKIISASAGTFYKPSLKVLGKYSAGGNTGALNAVRVSFASDLVTMGGLDRYVRVFKISDRLLVAKVYVATQISSIITVDDKVQATEEEKDENDEEELWQQLEQPEQPEPQIVRKKRRI